MTPTTPAAAAETGTVRAAADRRSAALRGLLAETRELQGHIDRAHEAKDYAAYNGHVRRLRAIFREHPTAWRLTGDLARKTSLLLADVVTGDPHAQESMLAGMEQLRADLGYARSPQLERVLIDQVALAWVNAEVAGLCFARLAYEGGREPEHAAFWEKRVESAERRLQRAVESLARTRKLVRSTKLVQINYAHQQVVQNAVGVAGAAAASLPEESRVPRPGAPEPPRIAAASSVTPARPATTSTSGDRTPEAVEIAVAAAGKPVVGNADLQCAKRGSEPEGEGDAWEDDFDDEGFDEEDYDEDELAADDDFFADDNPIDDLVSAAPSRAARQWASTLPSQLFRTTPDEVPLPGPQEARLEPDEIEGTGPETGHRGRPGDAGAIAGRVAGFFDEMERNAGA